MWLTTKQVSEMTGYSTKTLAAWRSKKIGPAWAKPAGTKLVRYRRQDVESWLEAGFDTAA